VPSQGRKQTRPLRTTKGKRVIKTDPGRSALLGGHVFMLPCRKEVLGPELP
jgi:hypothetical protein